MRRIITLIAFLFIALSGCATHIPDSIIGSAKVDNSQIIGVETFEFNPKAAIGINQAAVENFGIELSENISAELLKAGFRSSVIKNKLATEEMTYIIRGRILEVNGGSRGQRIWLGFGAGAANVTVRGEMLNAKTKENIKNFTITKQSNWTYGGNETAVRENLNEVALEIVNNIKNSP